MRSREERVSKISEKMKSKKGKDYQGEKAQDFKNKYTEDVKTAVKGRRGRKHEKEMNTDEMRKLRQQKRRQLK